MKKQQENPITMTHHLLLAQFSNRLLIPIEELAEPYLGVAANTAKRKAKSNELPFPCFKVAAGQKAPYVVHLVDLVRYIDKCTNDARCIWEKHQYH